MRRRDARRITERVRPGVVCRAGAVGAGGWLKTVFWIRAALSGSRLSQNRKKRANGKQPGARERTG